VKSNAYIVAGCKEWNRQAFEILTQGRDEAWHFVRNEDELRSALATTSPRYIFFLHWNWRVPAEVWGKVECVCFHMTDVPYGRGGAPLQNLIAAGHENTVVTALRMVEDMDAGPVYVKRPMSLEGRAIDIYDRAGAISVDIIRWMVQAEPVPQPQLGEPVIFKRRTPAQSELPTEGDLVGIYNHIRMLDAPGYSLAFLEYGQLRVEFSNARMVDEEIVAEVVVRKRPRKD
jgi:methionyl-tRNA formyltransferase